MKTSSDRPVTAEDMERELALLVEPFSGAVTTGELNEVLYGEKPRNPAYELREELTAKYVKRALNKPERAPLSHRRKKSPSERAKIKARRKQKHR